MTLIHIGKFKPIFGHQIFEWKNNFYLLGGYSEFYLIDFSNGDIQFKKENTFCFEMFWMSQPILTT